MKSLLSCRFCSSLRRGKDGVRHQGALCRAVPTVRDLHDVALAGGLLPSLTLT